MNKFYVFLILFSITALTYGQSKKLAQIGEFSLENSGAIMNKESNVDGYYFFYLMDKLKKGKSGYGIQILDKNLNEIAFKKHIAAKNTYLKASKYNENGVMFAFENSEENKINLVVFNKEAKKIRSKTFQLTKKEMLWNSVYSDGMVSMLSAIPNKGFLFTRMKDHKKHGYAITYIPTYKNTEGRWPRGWTYKSPPKANELIIGTPIEVNERFVVVLEHRRPGLYSRKTRYVVKILDANTGKEIASREDDDEIPKFITSAFLNTEDNLVLMGEYYDIGDNPIKDKSVGLFIETIDSTGNSIKKNTASWENDIDPYLKNVNKEENEYIFFHKMVPMSNGKYYAIGEKYKKTASVGGIALKILTRGAASGSQLTITDVLIFEFDSNFKITNISQFEKGKSNVPSATDLGSPQLNAFMLASMESFDHKYTQVDTENNRFYSCFIDYERLKGEKNRTAFKTIIYDVGEFSEDKIFLDKKGVITKVFPGKLGHVVILEYNKKEKSIALRMEKLNID
ncbi:MAG: hypothetical protein JKY22_08185 [Flavobacteriaceae bacterium]|nr:hypothetical protein [Flavobacteriaceae bacterium]